MKKYLRKGEGVISERCLHKGWVEVLKIALRGIRVLNNETKNLPRVRGRKFWKILIWGGGGGRWSQNGQKSRY